MTVNTKAKRASGSGMVDAGKYEILYDLPEGEYGETAVGGMRTKTIRAGDSLEIESFPLLRVEPAAKAEKKRRGTSPAQQRLNLENARKKLQRYAETNFTAQDYVLHPTFDYGFIDRDCTNREDAIREWEQLGYPVDEYQARRKIKNYIERIRRLIRRKGGDPKAFKYIYVIESTKEPQDGDFNALPARYHYHMIISSMGGKITQAELNALWEYGYTKAEPLDFRFNGLEGLCKYITKQRRFTRRWAHSQNLKEPEITVSDRRISRRRAAAIAADVRANAREILEKIYPGYTLEDCTVKYSDFIAGAYIYARMRRRPAAGNGPRKYRKGGGMH